MNRSRTASFLLSLFSLVITVTLLAVSFLPVCAEASGVAPDTSTYTEKRVNIQRGASMLTSQQKAVYDIIRRGLCDQSERIDFSSYKPSVSELNYIFSSIINSEPEFFYVDIRYSYGSSDNETAEYLIPSYIYKGSELTRVREEYESLIRNILDQTSDSWSELEKALFVHDHIVKNFRYDTEYLANGGGVYDAYRFLTEGKGVCQAYTLLASELLGRMGIESDSVVSDAMNHVWNCVKIDGRWYHMDITHDDPIEAGTNADFFDEVYYSNFLCGDDAIRATGHDGWSVGYTFSDSFDHLFIKGFDAQTKIDISPLGDDWYILVGTKTAPMGVSIGRAELDENSYDAIGFLDCMWNVPNSPNGYYTSVYAGLGSYHDSLVISTSNALYAYNPDTDSIVHLQDCVYDEGSVYGMIVNGSIATLRVDDVPNSFSGSVFKKVDLSEILFDVTVEYKNTSGVAIYPKYSQKLGWGKDFSVTLPEIEGYTSSVSKVEGCVPLGGINKTVNYGAYRTLRIDYVYENGDKAYDSYIDTFVEVGKAYSVVSPNIAKHMPSAEKVEGTMGMDDVTITVIYSPATYTVKIHYVYADGRTAANAVTRENLRYGDRVNVNSPVIGGYTADKTVVSVIVEKNTEITVTYSAVPCTLIVEYRYADGTLINTVDRSLGWGSNYDIKSPDITGYTPDKASVTGTLKKDLERITVTYTLNKHKLTVVYLYEDGSPAGDTYVRSDVGYRENYSITSPVIEGYECSVPIVSGSLPDEDLTVTVIYRKTRFTISFTVGGEIFFSYDIARGEPVRLPDSVPVKQSTKTTVYSFNRWQGYSDSLTAQGDISFEAVFSEMPRKYRVVFENHDGTKLFETEVLYGERAVYEGKTPTCPPENGITYTFVGWSEDTDVVTEDITVRAMFSDGVTKYKVTFYDEDGSVLKVDEVFYGENATPPTVPKKESDKTYSYVFDQWIGKYRKVTADTEIRASYRAEYIDYEIVFKNYDSSVICTVILHYGDEIPYVDTPEREGDEQYDYFFEAWYPAMSSTVRGNAEYTAVFVKEPKHEKTAQDLALAVAELQEAKTLSERFEKIREACEVRDKIYLKDPDAAESLDILAYEIEKYNSEVDSINNGFSEACGTLLSVSTFSTEYLSAIVLLWTVLKKLLGV